MAQKSGRYCVEAGNNPEALEVPFEETYSTRNQALDAAQKQMGLYRCVWVSEIGEYRTRNDSWKPSWVYFWWTPATGCGDLPPLGYGRPISQSQFVEYRAT